MKLFNFNMLYFSTNNYKATLVYCRGGHTRESCVLVHDTLDTSSVLLGTAIIDKIVSFFVGLFTCFFIWMLII